MTDPNSLFSNRIKTMCSNRGTSGAGVGVRVEGGAVAEGCAGVGDRGSVVVGTVAEIATDVGDGFGAPQEVRHKAKRRKLNALFIKHLLNLSMSFPGKLNSY